MNENTYTIKNLLDNLLHKNLIDGNKMALAEAYLQNKKPIPGVPWYIQLLIAIGAWTSAIFLIAFLSISRIINYDDKGTMIVLGLLFLGGSLGLNYKYLGIFPRQLALALSVTAHALILMGISTHRHAIASIALASIVLCLVLYPLYRDSLHRFLSCLLAIALLTAWALDSRSFLWLHLQIVAELLGIGLMFTLLLRAKKWAPLAYALAVSLPMTLFLGLFSRHLSYYRDIVWWPSQITLSLWLCWIFYRTFREMQQRSREPLYWALACALLLGIVSTPGILAAIGILVIGYGLPDKLIGFLGLVFFPVFIFFFYYNLNLALDTKSYILMATGALLLLGRQLLRKRLWAGGVE